MIAAPGWCEVYDATKMKIWVAIFLQLSCSVCDLDRYLQVFRLILLIDDFFRVLKSPWISE